MAEQWTGEAYWAGGAGWWERGERLAASFHQLLDGHPYCQAWVRVGGFGSPPSMVSAERKGVGSAEWPDPMDNPLFLSSKLVV